ncbi:MAG: R2-like ligand-binding oxidase [Ardenticatenaceae bacterium]
MASLQPSVRTGFASTTRGLDRSSPSYRLFQKAKKLGVWNPNDLDLTQDKIDFANMSELEQDWVKRQIALFVGGEEAVTLDLLPLITVIAKEGRIEEEMFLTTFLFEEAKHLDFFTGYVAEVIGETSTLNLDQHHSENYKAIFHHALPTSLRALETDPSPAAQVRASITYNMVVEGVLAETGYNNWFQALQKGNRLPGLQEGIRLLKQDESRHIAYGVFLLSRLIVEDDSLWDVVEATFAELMPRAMGFIQDGVARYGSETLPFELDSEENAAFMRRQYEKRYARIERARGATMESLYRVTNQIIDQNDG